MYYLYYITNVIAWLFLCEETLCVDAKTQMKQLQVMAK